MRKMKDSGIAWIGEIPESWELKTIKQLLIERNEKNRELQTGTILSLSAKSGVTLYDGENHSGNKPREDLSDYKVVYPGDIVVNSMNILSGSVGLSDYKGCVSPVYYIYYPRFNDNREFLHYIFQSKQFQLSLRGLGNGIMIKETESGALNTIRMRIPSQKLAAQLFPVCSREEQERILFALDRDAKRIESLIANQEAQIEKLKAYKQSLITEVVTKGLDPNVPMKDSGVEWIGEILEKWKIRPLKTMFDFGKGLPITKADLTTEGVQVVSYGQIHSKHNAGTYLHQSLVRYVNEGYLHTNGSSLGQQGDLFFADTSEDYDGIGNAVYLDTNVPTFAGYHTIIAHPYDMRYSKYFAYLFLTDSWRRQLRCMASGIKVFSVTQTMLRRVSVLLPDEKECEAITSYLDSKCNAVDSLIAIKQAKIEKLNEYKKTLIYEYVTGKREA